MYTCKLYSMKDESKQTELQAHIFQTPSITVERLSNRYNIAHAQFTHHCIISSENSRISENWVFYWNLEKEFTFLYLLLLACIYCVGWVRLGSTIRWRRCAPGINDTRMRFAREKRQHYMYLCKIMWTPWIFFFLNKPSLMFYWL